MAEFILTAKQNIDRPNADLHINKGDQINIHINVNGIRPFELFSNGRCQKALIQQFRQNGIDVPISDRGVFGFGSWDVKMK